jgi:lipopolysaccharide transport protein LptA
MSALPSLRQSGWFFAAIAGLGLAVGLLTDAWRGSAQTDRPANPRVASTTTGRSETGVDQAASTRAQSGTPSSKTKNSPSDTNNSPFGAFENKNRGPINIVSNSMDLDYKNTTVQFNGKVHAVQADGQLTSNTLNVKYGKDFHVVQYMIADGTVRVSQGQTQWCTADHIVMNEITHTAVLTGSPVCHDNADQIAGPKITVHTDTGMSEVEGGVKALVFPEESQTGDNNTSSGHAN